jgi:hypothetical protein
MIRRQRSAHVFAEGSVFWAQLTDRESLRDIETYASNIRFRAPAQIDDLGSWG